MKQDKKITLLDERLTLVESAIEDIIMAFVSNGDYFTSQVLVKLGAELATKIRELKAHGSR